LALAYGMVRLALPLPPSPTVRVGLVQGNVAQEIKWAPSERRRILSAHLDATKEAAARGATLVVWPESSVPLPLTSNETYRTMLEDLSGRLGIDLVVGSVHYVPGPNGPEAVYNSAVLLSGSQGGKIVDRYDKRHLVPFGEYVPMRSWLGPVEKMVEEASDFSSGRRTAVFESGTARLGPFICFEAIFPGLVREIVAAGAQILVNLTNDAFLGDTAGPRQHLELAAVRAVENRRWMVRAANTGISAVIDPFGRVTQALPYGTAGVLVADVPLLEARSLYTRAGDAAGWICVLVCALALISPFPPRNPLRKGRDRA
ncbi:MAG TPA: apolipoprotein N-acyltransferase, partial [Candidatus Saccharimonadales bacterium]|nr:apolipoprotein N-acyltransferase [Candidatus Saccharimonadales bacterium]